jgi:hypothetical protein
VQQGNDPVGDQLENHNCYDWGNVDISYRWDDFPERRNDGTNHGIKRLEGLIIPANIGKPAEKAPD